MTVEYKFYSSRPRVVEDEGAQISGYATVASYVTGGVDCTEITRKFKEPWNILFEKCVDTPNYFAWNRSDNTIQFFQSSGAEATAVVSATAYFTANGLAHLSWGKR